MAELAQPMHAFDADLLQGGTIFVRQAKAGETFRALNNEDYALEPSNLVQRAHAISNGVFVAAVNRIGHEGPLGGGLEFWGGSFLADPFGVVVAEATTDREEVLVGEVSLPRIDEVRRNWPFLRDRRIDAYAGIDRRYLD